MKTKQLIDSFGIATMYNDFVDVQPCMWIYRDKTKNMDMKNFLFRKNPLAYRNINYKKWYKIGDFFRTETPEFCEFKIHRKFS